MSSIAFVLNGLTYLYIFYVTSLSLDLLEALVVSAFCVLCVFDLQFSLHFLKLLQSFPYIDWLCRPRLLMLRTCFFYFELKRVLL